MTVQEIREAAKVMEAYANGKKIQYLNDDNEWIDAPNPLFDWDNCVYRIKPEDTYRPFETKEECWNEMLKHNEFGWVKSKTRDANKHISNIEKDIEGNVWYVAASFSGIEKYSPKQMLDYFVFMDGEPFGIKEE